MNPWPERVFAASLLLLGIVHVLFGERVARMLPAWHEGLPGRPLWAHAAGVVLTALAALVLLDGRSRRACVALGAFLLLPVLALQLPRAIRAGELGAAWLPVLKWTAMSAGAFVVAARRPLTVSRVDTIVARAAALAPWLLGAFMLYSAYLHLLHTESVATLMQPWMPWRTFWVYFAAAALALGGVSLVVPRTARLAALLTCAMLLGFFVLVHVPRMLADPAGPVGWSEMGEAMAFAMMALMLARRD